MKLILRWLASAAALLAVAYLVPGITVDSVGTAFVAALVLGLVNGLLGPVVRLLSFPITLLTLGLFSLVVSALLFGLAAYLVPGFGADGPVALLVGSLAYGVLAWIITSVVGARS